MMIDGKEYSLKSDIDLEINKMKDELHKEVEKMKEGTPAKFNLLNKDVVLMDGADVMAISPAELKGDWFISRYSISYLERIVKMLKLLNPDTEGFDIVCSKDLPLCMGRIDKESGKFVGVVLAPRIGD